MCCCPSSAASDQRPLPLPEPSRRSSLKPSVMIRLHQESICGPPCRSSDSLHRCVLPCYSACTTGWPCSLSHQEVIIATGVVPPSGGHFDPTLHPVLPQSSRKTHYVKIILAITQVSGTSGLAWLSLHECVFKYVRCHER